MKSYSILLLALVVGLPPLCPTYESKPKQTVFVTVNSEHQPIVTIYLR